MLDSRFFSTVIVLVFFAFSLNGCGGGKDSTETEPKESVKQIVIGVSQEPDTLNKLFMEMAASTDIYYCFSEDMVEYDSQWNLMPRTVEEIPSLENGSWELLGDNKMRTTWKIKETAKWQDGNPLVADDFIFAYKVTMDDRQPVISRDMENRIESMEAVDAKTLVVNWKELYAYADQGHRFLPSHILKNIYEKDPVGFKDHDFGRNPMGNGAFMLEEWSPGSHVILKKNPHFDGEKPWMDRVVYQIIPNTNTLEANLISDTIQAITTVGLTFDQALGLQKRKGEEVNVFFTDGLVWEHIDCNTENPLLSDKRMRQVLMYTMNRQEICDTLFDKRLNVAHSWLPEKHYGYNENVKKYQYDPKMAIALLEEMGWTEKDSDGIRKKDGTRLELIIMTTAGNKVREQIQQVIQKQCFDVGIKLEIRNQPAKVFFGETMRNRKFPHLAMYAWVMGPTSDGESLWTIKNIPCEENNWQGQNNPGWRNEEANALDLMVPGEIDMEKRRELLYRQQEIWTEEVPSLPLYFDADLSATRKDLENWRPTGTQTPVTWNCEQWKYAK